MATFKEFLEKSKSEKSTALTASSSSALANVITKEIISSPLVNISNTEASEFSKKISDLATSEEVISELSNEIGTPKTNETEDEFVDRAKSKLKIILKRKLSK